MSQFFLLLHYSALAQPHTLKLSLDSICRPSLNMMEENDAEWFHFNVTITKVKRLPKNCTAFSSCIHPLILLDQWLANI